MRSKCSGDEWCRDSSLLAGWGFIILRHIHAWLIACKLQHASTMRWKQWSQGQTQKKELTLTWTIPQDFMKMPESVNVIKRAILFTNLSLSSKPSKPNPSRPQLFRALSATSTLRSTESSRCGSAKPQGFSLPFLRRYGVVYVANTTQKQIGIFFLLGMFKMDICLESSKLSIFLEVRQKWHSQQLSKREKQTIFKNIYHTHHSSSINQFKKNYQMFCWNK